MDLETLTVFDQVVREGSFSKAAWRLELSQPTVSSRIKALEREVGVSLFVRGRKLALTEGGLSLLPHARAALASYREGLEAARLARGDRGRLAVGALRSLTGLFLAPVLAQYYAQFPQVECLVREGEHSQVVALLCDGIVELALICWPCLSPPPTDLTPLLYLCETLVFVVPHRHPLAQRSSVTVEDVLAAAHPLLLLRWWQQTPTALSSLASQVSSVADVSTETGRFLLSQGVGMGFFPRMVIAQDLEAGRVVEVRLEGFSDLLRESALVRLNRSSPLSSAAAQFETLLRARAQALDLWVG